MIVKWILVLLAFAVLQKTTQTSHYVLNSEHTKIVPLLTSPYYLRNPDDLVAFMNQGTFKNRIDDIMKELITIKANLTQKMNKLDVFTNDLTSIIACIPNYFLDETDLYSTIISKNYLTKINYKTLSQETLKDSSVSSNNVAMPKCSEFMPLDFSMSTFEHLESMKNRQNLKMEKEESLGAIDLGISTSNFPLMILSGFKNNPNSWKLYTLSSYYHRFKGNAHEAIECIRRAIYLAPRKVKDIPLLSLGTILQRANFINDSVVVLNAAVDHAPKVPENLLALGNTLLMLSQFNRSLECFNTAKNLDSLYNDRVDYIKKSITCFRDLKIILLTMESLLDEILPGLERYGELKKDFEEYHEKLEREQVPLTTRIFDDHYDNQKIIQRSQICSTRYTKDSNQPVLICDFISDIQLVMQDFAIDILNNYVDLKSELIETYKINLGIYRKIFVEKFSKVTDI